MTVVLEVVVLEVVSSSVGLIQLGSQGMSPQRVCVSYEIDSDSRQEKRYGRVKEEQEGEHGKQQFHII